jgi:hypothetical protein
LDAGAREAVVARVAERSFGLGPLEPLLRDPGVDGAEPLCDARLPDRIRASCCWPARGAKGSTTALHGKRERTWRAAGSSCAGRMQQPRLRRRWHETGALTDVTRRHGRSWLRPASGVRRPPARRLGSVRRSCVRGGRGYPLRRGRAFAGRRTALSASQSRQAAPRSPARPGGQPWLARRERRSRS